MAPATPSSTTRIPDDWQAQISPYREPIAWRSGWQLINTLVPYAVIWWLMVVSLEGPAALTVALGVLNGLLTIRLFIIQHDCGHGSFFRSRRLNDFVGFWTAFLVATPYLQWRHGHAIHHAKSGQTEARGVGYFWIMTVEEYQGSPWYVRGWYRFYRNPFVLFTIGGPWLFFCEFRLSFGSVNWRQRRGVHANTLLWLAVCLLLGSQFGVGAVFLLVVPVIATPAIAGLGLFYLQHHYEAAYWADKEDWSFARAALDGSSYVALPTVVEWFAGAINYHHIHHLAPRIPNYRLREAHLAVPFLNAVQPLPWADIARSWRLRLLDTETLTWRDYPRGQASTAPEVNSRAVATHRPCPDLGPSPELDGA